MKPNLLLCLALVLSGGLFGCATNQIKRSQSSTASEQIPHFENLGNAYSYIAKCENLPTDDKAVLKLAAESKIDVINIENIGEIQIIEANYFRDGDNEIRGAQWNGRYYVLRRNNEGFDLVGILEGNIYRWHFGKTLALQAHWHSGAWTDDAGWENYPWNGRTFGAIAPASLPTFYKPTSQ